MGRVYVHRGVAVIHDTYRSRQGNKPDVAEGGADTSIRGSSRLGKKEGQDGKSFERGRKLGRKENAARSRLYL